MDIETPSAVTVSEAGATGTFEFSSDFGPSYTERFHTAQVFIDSEVLRLCAPKVPRRVGALIDSGTAHTKTGSGKVIYKTPYARRWYYENADFTDAPMRGTLWFERMKEECGRDILKGAGKILRGK